MLWDAASARCPQQALRGLSACASKFTRHGQPPRLLQTTTPQPHKFSAKPLQCQPRFLFEKVGKTHHPISWGCGAGRDHGHRVLSSLAPPASAGQATPPLRACFPPASGPAPIGAESEPRFRGPISTPFLLLLLFMETLKVAFRTPLGHLSSSACHSCNRMPSVLPQGPVLSREDPAANISPHSPTLNTCTPGSQPVGGPGGLGGTSPHQGGGGCLCSAPILREGAPPESHTEATLLGSPGGVSGTDCLSTTLLRTRAKLHLLAGKMHTPINTHSRIVRMQPATPPPEPKSEVLGPDLESRAQPWRAAQ